MNKTKIESQNHKIKQEPIKEALITIEDDYEDYPSLELAYEISISSYDSIVKRIDALDGKIQNLTVASMTLFFAIPVLVKTQNLPINSCWFYGAMVLVIISVILSIIARIYGSVKLLDPNLLYEKWLHLPVKKFQSDSIHFAGIAFDENNKILNRKWRLSIASVAIYALALLGLVIWVSLAQSSHP